MNLYCFTTTYGTLNVSRITINNVELTADSYYKTREKGSVFPYIGRSFIPKKILGRPIEITDCNTVDNTERHVVAIFSTENDIERATLIFKNYYEYIISEHKEKIYALEKAVIAFNESHNNNLNKMLEKAIVISETAHCGQKDKGGNPYFTHPATVASMVSDTREKIVAYLHDIIEDTPVTAEFLMKQGFTRDIIDAVLLLSRDINVEYEEYLLAIKRNPLAKAVKIADLTHNSDLSRIPEPTGKDIERREKYLNSIKLLTS